ncbi:MAG: prephenate dehydrogenase [Bdellovibrionaceae bacterium]|nr:prephenate dehydrogenase [Pseudobdellovibrionaceae bacterium]
MKVGIIGLGDMGQLYARHLSQAGYEVVGCDLPQNFQTLKEQFKQTQVEILADGHQVAATSDWLLFAVEAENLDEVVKTYGPSVKEQAIVSGQTSVKCPEVESFENHLPPSTAIVPCHSLHAANVTPKGQSLVVFLHRGEPQHLQKTKDLLGAMQSKIIELSGAEEHDRMTADTQAVTHLGFLSMGTAWKNCQFFPWENANYIGGIDNVKILLTLRIYSGKSHVYAGLAKMNPFVPQQIRQYTQSESELFKMIIKEERKSFVDRVLSSGQAVFGNLDDPKILLDDDSLGEFSLSQGHLKVKPNSHLSLLAMVDTWAQLGVNPYKHLVVQTPLYRLRLGVAEELFRNSELLHDSIQAALDDRTIRGDDLEFHSAVREWSSVILNGSMAGYKAQFETTQAFFKDRLEDGRARSTELIQRLVR